MLLLFAIWIVVTLCSAAALLSFLVFDEWQVRSRSAAQEPAPAEAPTGTAVAQLV